MRTFTPGRWIGERDVTQNAATGFLEAKTGHFFFRLVHLLSLSPLGVRAALALECFFLKKAAAKNIEAGEKSRNRIKACARAAAAF